jgi:hypothetical protein
VVVLCFCCGFEIEFLWFAGEYIFETRKTRLQPEAHTMGINPINIKKSELYSNLNWVPTTNNRVQKTNVLQ